MGPEVKEGAVEVQEEAVPVVAPLVAVPEGVVVPEVAEVPVVAAVPEAAVVPVEIDKAMSV